MCSHHLSFLILLLATSANCQSYFTGAFVQNIANVSNLIKTIVVHGDKEASNANLFLSQIIMTATDMPVEAEGSGEKNAERKPFIPLSEFRKYATDYVESVARQKETSELKTLLGEALRELRMENVRRKVTMDKFVEKIHGDAVDKYNEVEKKMIDVEKNVIKFFTMKNTPSFSIEVHNDVMPIIKELNDLLLKDDIFDLIMSHHDCNDDVFLEVFQHFRNHAIFLAVSSTINKIHENRALLNDTGLFDKHITFATEAYKSFLIGVQSVNERREYMGFTFDKSFTAVDLASITESSNLPMPKNHNLFKFNWEKEEFEEKYLFLTVRRCGDKAYNSTFLSQQEEYKSHDSCTTALYRTELTNIPHSAKNQAKILREKAMKMVRENFHYGAALPSKIISPSSYPLTGVIAIYTTCDKSTVSDTVYTDEHTYKIVIAVEANYETYDRWGGHHRTNGVIQVIGYFMKPNDATY